MTFVDVVLWFRRAWKLILAVVVTLLIAGALGAYFTGGTSPSHNGLKSSPRLTAVAYCSASQTNSVYHQMEVAYDKAKAEHRGHLVAPTRHLAEGSCGYVVHSGHLRPSMKPSIRLMAVDGPFPLPHPTYQATSWISSIAWGVAWKAYMTTELSYDPDDLWSGWVNCDHTQGIGFQVTVQKCWWNPGGHVYWSNGGTTLNSEEDIQVSFLFNGFPIYASHEFETHFYITGASYSVTPSWWTTTNY